MALYGTQLSPGQLTALGQHVKFTFSASPSGSAVSYLSSVGPPAGYGWSIRRLCATGMTAGVTPDIVSFYLNAATGNANFWQLNGNQWGETFSDLQLTMYDGDVLAVHSVGTYASVATLVITGEAMQLADSALSQVAVT